MQTITLHQPRATLIALRIKTVEAWSWPAPARLVGQTIAIHSGNWAVPSIKRYREAWEMTGTGPFRRVRWRSPPLWPAWRGWSILFYLEGLTSTTRTEILLVSGLDSCDSSCSLNSWGLLGLDPWGDNLIPPLPNQNTR